MLIILKYSITLQKGNKGNSQFLIIDLIMYVLILQVSNRFPLGFQQLSSRSPACLQQVSSESPASLQQVCSRLQGEPRFSGCDAGSGGAKPGLLSLDSGRRPGPAHTGAEELSGPTGSGPPPLASRYGCSCGPELCAVVEN